MTLKKGLSKVSSETPMVRLLAALAAGGDAALSLFSERLQPAERMSREESIVRGRNVLIEANGRGLIGGC
jgi:hypothetical protein